MYNLLMAGNDDAWEGLEFNWSIEATRFLELTPEHLRTRFQSATDSVFQELMQLPTLFTYEHFGKKNSYVGTITNVTRGVERGRPYLYLTGCPSGNMPTYQPETLKEISTQLGILRGELWRNHWAVKDEVLLQALGLPQNFMMIANAAIPLQSIKPPLKVFISYSWDSVEHQGWVDWLARQLRSHGIDAFIDSWQIRGGQDLATYMERSVRDADRVLIIYTEAASKKAIDRTGGLGYEHTLVTGEMIEDMDTTKFIPVVRQALNPPLLPPQFRTRFRYDLSEGGQFQSQLQALIKELLNIMPTPPPLGRSPYLA